MSPWSRRSRRPRPRRATSPTAAPDASPARQAARDSLRFWLSLRRASGAARPRCRWCTWVCTSWAKCWRPRSPRGSESWYTPACCSRSCCTARTCPPGPERAFYWTLWLAPLTRIYGLAQPYAGAQPLAWWALTTVPMVVAGFVAIRLVGLSSDDVGLKPSIREAPVAIFMVPGWPGDRRHRVPGARTALGRPEDHPVRRRWPRHRDPGAQSGIVEEIVFRGVLQRGAVAGLGSVLGVIYVSLFYAALVTGGPRRRPDAARASR